MKKPCPSRPMLLADMSPEDLRRLIQRIALIQCLPVIVYRDGMSIENHEYVIVIGIALHSLCSVWLCIYPRPSSVCTLPCSAPSELLY